MKRYQLTNLRKLIIKAFQSNNDFLLSVPGADVETAARAKIAVFDYLDRLWNETGARTEKELKE